MVAEPIGTVETYVRQKLAAASIQKRPFFYLYINQVLPPDLYEEMRRSLPPEDYVMSCKPNSEGDSSRMFDLSTGEGDGDGLAVIGSEWRQRFELYIDLVGRLVVEKMKNKMTSYFGRMKARRHMESTPERIARGQSLFCFRPAGWQIVPHTHSLDQLLQTMIYFPSEGFHAGQGTYLYGTPGLRRPSIADQVKAVVPFKATKRPHLLPFAHNTLVSWINTPEAIHGTIDHSGDPSRRYVFLAHIIDRAVFPPITT